ncbi:hypothetical protein Tco_0750109 [Tanacetum coccineum]|uniref:Uncharacterized protein n=1 Tax=Tanacetum coccineum TaxID=301880 RepID=A0ABQ4Z3J0_9ASTR
MSKKELLRLDEELAFKLAQRLQAQEQDELIDKEKARLVNTFVDYKTELVKESSKKAKAEIAHESSLKRAGEELEQESSKKQKVLKKTRVFRSLRMFGNNSR